VRFAAVALCALLIQARPSPPAPTVKVTVVARAVQPGEVVALMLTSAKPIDAVHARGFDRELVTFSNAEGSFVLAGIDLDVKAGSYPVTIEVVSGKTTEHTTHTLVVRAKAFPTRQLKVDDAFVNPPASAQERIAQDTRDLNDAWSHPAATKLWGAGFIKPVVENANSAFGSRSVFNGQARNPHSGADFPSPAGTPVKAPGAGRVVIAKDLYFSGNTVVIDHGLGLFSLLAHLSAIDVQPGATVKAGDIVGKVGATGRVTGPHLHWAVRLAGARVDPMSLLAAIHP
jgi:biotin carboxyl carrier protein